MSFFGRSAPVARVLNTAELLKINSVRATEARQARIVAFVPTFVKHVLNTVNTSSTTELAPQQEKFNLNNLFASGTTHVLTLPFTNGRFPFPNETEKDFILKEAKLILEDPVKHGLTVHITESNGLVSQTMTVDWSAPKVVEPPKVAVTPAVPAVIPVDDATPAVATTTLVVESTETKLQ